MNNLVKDSHHYWMILKLSIKLKSTWAAKWGTSEAQQDIPRYLGTNSYMNPYVETVSCGVLSLAKILQKSSQGYTQVHFISIKTSKWEKWWSWWLRITNAFILCNLLWKIQKVLQWTEKVALNTKNEITINGTI